MTSEYDPRFAADLRPESAARGMEKDRMTGRLSTPLPYLRAGAFIVVLAWGISAASHIISILLLSLLLAYCILPLPLWLKHRFQLGKAVSLGSAVAIISVGYLLLCTYLVNAGYRMISKLPVYQERLAGVYAGVTPFLVSHGIHASSLSTEVLFSPERIIGYARVLLPVALGSLTEGVLIGLLSLLFVLELADEPARQSRLVAALTYYGRDVQTYIGIAAKSGALTALVNLALLAVVGVDFPLLWCVLYFFLQFIPNIGAIVAVGPPALVALLMLGWERALIVAGGMVLANILSANVLNPILLKDSANITFLEIMLSLIIWGTLLGFWGSILAIPLTLVLKRVVEDRADVDRRAAAASA